MGISCCMLVGSYWMRVMGQARGTHTRWRAASCQGFPLVMANGLVYAASFSMIFAQTPERVLVLGRILRFEFSLEERHEEQVPSSDLHVVNPKEAPKTSLQSTVVHEVDNHRVLVECSLLCRHAIRSRIFGGPSGYRAIESPSCWVAVPPTIMKA